MEELVIYFVYNQETQLIKIGVTINLTNRLVELRGDYRQIDLLGVMPGSFTEKTALHRRFARQRIRRTDWFRDSPELRAYIQRHASPRPLSSGLHEPAIDRPISLSPYVRRMLDLYRAELRAQGVEIDDNQALEQLFEQYLPRLARRAMQELEGINEPPRKSAP